MSKKPQYDPAEIRFPDQHIVESPLVRRWKDPISNMPCLSSWAVPCPTCGTV